MRMRMYGILNTVSSMPYSTLPFSSAHIQFARISSHCVYAVEWNDDDEKEQKKGQKWAWDAAF